MTCSSSVPTSTQHRLAHECFPLAHHSCLWPLTAAVRSLPTSYSSFQSLLVLVSAVMVTMALSSRRKLFRVGRWWRAAGDSSSSAGTRTGSSAPPHVLLVHDPAHRAPESSPAPWCFETISALGMLARRLKGNVLPSVLTHLLLQGNFLILRKMCFPLKKVHRYGSTTLIWPLV